MSERLGTESVWRVLVRWGPLGRWATSSLGVPWGAREGDGGHTAAEPWPGDEVPLCIPE